MIGDYGPTVLRTQSPYWLRVNGVWCHLEGVRPGSSTSSTRPTGEFTSVDGYRYVQSAPTSPRDWTLDFEHATPEAVALLQVAAESSGDVWLLDETAARSNMLSPRETHSMSNERPVIMCNGTPLRSVTTGVTNPPPVEVQAKANVGRNQLPGSGGRQEVGSLLGVADVGDVLIKFSVPSAPEGATLDTAELLVTVDALAPITISALQSDNDWIEVEQDIPAGTWSTIPASGAAMGAATFEAGRMSVSLSNVLTYLGSDMSLRLRRASGGLYCNISSRATATPPILRLGYTLGDAEPHVASTQVRAGQRYWVSLFTDAEPDATLGTLSGPGVAETLTAPAGAGARELILPVEPDADGLLTMTVNPSGLHLVAGLSVAQGGPLRARQWAPGGATPCKVHVDDPERETARIGHDGLGYGTWSVTLREVA